MNKRMKKEDEQEDGQEDEQDDEQEDEQVEEQDGEHRHGLNHQPAQDKLLVSCSRVSLKELTT